MAAFITAAIASFGAWASTTAGIMSLASTAFSMAYQITMGAKAKKKSAAAADARKGHEFVEEGEVTAIPLVYGKSMIGGVRAWHATANNFLYTAPNSDRLFTSGAGSKPGGSYTINTIDQETGLPHVEVITYDALPSGNLNKDMNGSKNEFLFFQQALCIGPIHAVHDVVIEEGMYIDDPLLGTYNNNDAPTFNARPITDNVKAATHIGVDYGTSEADAIITKNFGERGTAKFTNLAYASAVFRLDRDAERVFNGVPKLQFLVEGRKVRTVNVDGSLSDRVYTNNPAYCLLDYLLDEQVGRALPLESIDLQSFRAAANVCGTVVMPAAPVGGKIWKNTDGSRNVSTREVPLYECNMIVNPEQTIRENVEAILGTMGDARLVWSGSKYKLLLQYPANDEAIIVADTITDDDLISSDNISMAWPDTTTRLNYCTIRFHNEAENFKEDSVSWPPKDSGRVFKGIGGQRYPAQSGWDEDTDTNKFLNEYGVWNSNNSVSNISYIVMPKVSGTYTLRYSGDDSINISVGGHSYSTPLVGAVQVRTFNLNADEVVTIIASGNDNGGKRGLAATLTSPDGNLFWSTRSEAFSSYVIVEASSDVYDEYVLEDSGLQLETDIFADGVTDYYHALAKAEEMVRTSRSAILFNFKAVLRDKFYEPGDVVKLESEALALNDDIYIKLTEVKTSEGGIAELSGSRFLASQLAWNVDDADAGSVPPIGEYAMAPPYNFVYSVAVPGDGSDGKLSWVNSGDNRVINYILYFHTAGKMGTDGRPVFDEIGRATLGPFTLHNLAGKAGIFGIRGVSASGALTELITTSVTDAIVIPKDGIPPKATGLLVEPLVDEIKVAHISWNIPAARVDGTAYNDHSHTRLYLGKSSNFLEASLLNSSFGTSIDQALVGSGLFYFWVVLVSRAGIVGPASTFVSIEVKPTVEDIIDIIIPGIVDDPAWGDLGNRIDLIEIDIDLIVADDFIPGSVKNLIKIAKDELDEQLAINAAAIINLQIVDGETAATIAALGSRVGNAESNIITINTVNSQQASSITTLNTKMGAAESNITNLFTTTADQATSLLNLVTRMGSAESSISTLNNTTADQATNLTQLNTKAGNAESSINILNTTTATTASNLTNLSTKVDGNTTSINTLNTTTANQASTLSQLNSTVGGHSTSIQTLVSTTDGIKAKYAVKIDNNGAVIGFGLVSDPNNLEGYGSVSRFYIRSDSFAIGAPSSPIDNTNPPAANIPFIVYSTPQNMGGGVIVQPGVYMKSAFITHLTADKIDTRNLTIKDSFGNIVMSAGGVSASKVSGLGTLATQNRIQLGTAGNPTQLSVDGIDLHLDDFVSGLRPITLGNISTFIAGAVIGSAYIQDAAITNAKIANATISGAKIANATIGTANIGDAQITNAKIGNLEVSTLKIAGQAVTVPSSTTSSGSLPGLDLWIATPCQIYVHAVARFSEGSSPSEIGFSGFTANGNGFGMGIDAMTSRWVEVGEGGSNYYAYTTVGIGVYDCNITGNWCSIRCVGTSMQPSRVSAAIMMAMITKR